MKKILVVFAILLAGKFVAMAGEPNIAGVWLVGDKDYKIELKRIYMNYSFKNRIF